MVGFIVGLFIGAFLGVLVMCLCNIASKTDENINVKKKDNNNEK